MIVGIDPDTLKSGVATKTKGSISLYSLSFFQLFDFLSKNRESITNVRVEASWLIKHNWHAKLKGTAAINTSIGNDAGRNHETGRKIVEMCVYLEIPYQEVKPLKKIWKGPDKKITHQELAMLIPGIPKRTNQEVRDAALLII